MKFASSLLVLTAGAVSASIVPGQNFFDRRAGIQPPIQGDISFKIPGRNITAKTHFKAYGNYKNLLVTPLVVLHGGPGIPSNYLTPIADLAQWMPVIIYDQIGSGTSSHFPETIGDTSFWTEALFEAELKNLLKTLGIENNFSLYGHSWGGMLGARFAATQPKGLKKLVLASSPATIPLWLKVANELRDKLPAQYRTALDKHEADGTTDAPEYLAAVQYFYDLHVVRIVPNPADVQASFAGLGEDPTVYLTMNGPNEFSIIGPLKVCFLLLLSLVARLTTAYRTGPVSSTVPRSRYLHSSRTASTTRARTHASSPGTTSSPTSSGSSSRYVPSLSHVLFPPLSTSIYLRNRNHLCHSSQSPHHTSIPPPSIPSHSRFE